MKRSLLGALLTAAAFLVLPQHAGAQGVTTGAIGGTVRATTGEPLEGATVEAVYLPSGFRATVRVGAGGRFLIQNLEPGGPYRVTARAIGYRAVTEDNVDVNLSQMAQLSFALEAAPVTLEDVVVMSDPLAADFASDRTGAQTLVTDSLLRRLPTLSRDFTDFVSITPQVSVRDGAGGGITAAGQNNRFNTIQVDGSTVNDRFGLGATGQSGGQANGRSVGIEAVKEYQVLLAPYDVRQGNFTGALINAVTRSGTNDFRAYAHWFFRNQGLAGDPLGQSDFKSHQFGAAIGGPLVRDKAHFFINAEFRRKDEPATGPYLGQPSDLAAPVFKQADIDAFNAALQNYGLPTGDGNLFTKGNPLNNLMARVDWQLNPKNRLVFRYIYNTADDDVFSRTTSTANPTIDLTTVAYSFKNRTHNPAIQLFTNFDNGASNEFRVSFNRIRDQRAPAAVVPLVIVQNFTQAGGSGTYSLESGGERFSQGNELDQDIWEITDNYTFPVGTSHRVTLGTRNELYKVRNLFAQSSYGVWTFDGLSEFQAGTVERYEGSGDIGGQGLAARFTAGQLGFYAQDQWQASSNFNLTLGLRADIPFFTENPTYDSRVVRDFGAQEVPSWQILLSPRVGFNWDMTSDGVNQLRGGAGIFVGTPAYVWYSNAYSNNGTKLGQITCGLGTSSPSPTFDPTTIPTDPTCGDGRTIGSGTIGEVDLVSKDTKFPQVFRANVGYDRRLPYDMILTLEGIYTKGINDFFIVNRNLLPSTAKDKNGRVMYGTIGTNASTTPNYFDDLYGPSFNGGVYDLLNTSKNYSYSGTIQLRKRWTEALTFTGAYTYAKAKDVQSFTSSRAISNWRFGRVFSGDQFTEEATTSQFDRPHRIQVTAAYTFPWREWPTDVSLSYTGQSGQPYNYVATGSSGRGDLNADGTNGNDPIYIPTDATNPSEIMFRDISGGATASDQALAFEQFIASESCLNGQRGQIMERNSCRNPWQNFVTFSFRQSLPAFGGNRLAFELDIFNVLNLLNSDWGLVKTAGASAFGNVSLLQHRAQTAGPVSSSQPIYEWDVKEVDNRFRAVNFPGNSYQIQFGIRYSY